MALFPERHPTAIRPVHGLGKRFGDLRVRPKLIILHNLFFLVLSLAVYLSLIPGFERRVASAKLIEVSLVTQIFMEDRPLLHLPQMETYDYRVGSAPELQVPVEAQEWMKQHPMQVWHCGSTARDCPTHWR